MSHVRLHLALPLAEARTVALVAAGELRERMIAAVAANPEAIGRTWEHFHGNTGVGLGADAQPGWTAMVANLMHEAHAGL